MPEFLLDEQISPEVARGLGRKNKSIVVHCMVEWQNGGFMGLSDELILEEAASQNLTLVTYDRRTSPPLLKRWAEEGRSHGGVIFVDNRTIPSSNFGDLIRALGKVWTAEGRSEWTNSILFLQRP